MNRAKKRKLAAEAAKVAEYARRKTGRSCGECTACCSALRVEALAKPAHVRCRHLCASGCAIYERRPRECAAFLCGWLLGWGPDEARPDRSGFILAVPGRDPGSRLFRLIAAVAGAVPDTPLVQQLKQQIRERMARQGLPCGFMIDNGPGAAQFEIPPGSQDYFRVELRRHGALPEEGKP